MPRQPVGAFSRWHSDPLAGTYTPPPGVSLVGHSVLGSGSELSRIRDGVTGLFQVERNGGSAA